MVVKTALVSMQDGEWFNNRAGYFLTATTGDKEGEDIFAHHTMITVIRSNDMVQGEYVNFRLFQQKKGDHECQAEILKV